MASFDDPGRELRAISSGTPRTSRAGRVFTYTRAHSGGGRASAARLHSSCSNSRVSTRRCFPGSARAKRELDAPPWRAVSGWVESDWPSNRSSTRPVTGAARVSGQLRARVPLLFGPSPVHRLERLSEHLGGEVEIWAKREDCNSGPRVRRQQGAQARVPRRRRARAGLRHARLDRRRAVEPHAPGRRGRRAARPRLRARAGALGRVAGRRLRQGRQHPALADHGRRRAARSRPGSTSASGQSWEEALGVGRGARRQALRDPGRRLRPSARRARVRALGRGGGRAGSASSASSSTRSSSAR